VLWPAFAGVVIVEATKQLYQGIPARPGRRLRPALRPALAQPAATASRDGGVARLRPQSLSSSSSSTTPTKGSSRKAWPTSMP
jgi:hypothetical protein